MEKILKIDAKIRIDKLKKLIEYYRYAYHVLDKSLISDGALDSLKHELQDLENQFPEFVTPDSPTQRVGGPPVGSRPSDAAGGIAEQRSRHSH